MHQILLLLTCLWLPTAYAGLSLSTPEPADFHGQLDELTELITVEAQNEFRALQNQTLAPDRLGGALLLTNPQPDWITQSRELRLGLAKQGWDLMTAEPSSDQETVRARALAVIDAQRSAGNRRIIVIALESQAANAIELVKGAADLRLVLYNASSEATLGEQIAAQVESLSGVLTVELYQRTRQTTEASRRHLLARKQRLETYQGRALIGPPLPPGELNRASTKRILGAIKTLIIEFEQQNS